MEFETEERHNKTEHETEGKPINTGTRHMIRMNHGFLKLTSGGLMKTDVVNPHRYACLQCDEPIGPGSREITVRSTGTGQLAVVCLDCLGAWLRWGPSQ
jgi:RNase P subunit RPR2